MADESLIEEARLRAETEHTTLHEQFRLWLKEYVRRKQRADTAIETINLLRDRITTKGSIFTRNEMNERR